MSLILLIVLAVIQVFLNGQQSDAVTSCLQSLTAKQAAEYQPEEVDTSTRSSSSGASVPRTDQH